MSIKKYVLVAFLSLGICSGNADVCGMKKTGKGTTKSVITKVEKVLNVNCAKVIRDYIKDVNRKVYGNVLAFECDVILWTNVNTNWIEEYKNPAIIVLKNGDFKDPRYVQFTANKGTNQTDVPVYYISFDKILNSLKYNIKDMTTDSKQLQVTQYAEIAEYLKDADESGAWRSRKNTLISFLENLNTSFYKAFIESGNFEIDFMKNFEWWKMARHTEVQFEILKKLQEDNDAGVFVEIDDNTFIVLNRVNNVKTLYSMFEPCNSCRELNTMLDKDTCFRYFAIDGNMSRDIDAQYEIYPHRIWIQGEPNDEGRIDFAKNEALIFGEQKWINKGKIIDDGCDEVAKQEANKLSTTNKQKCNNGTRLFRAMYSDKKNNIDSTAWQESITNN